MRAKYMIAHAILWATAIVSSAILGAPPAVSTLLLPSLASSAMLLTWTGSRRAQCHS